MSHFCCPVCGQPLTTAERSLRCANGHSFDTARSGYVNLLRSQQSRAKRHGDDKHMLTARRNFLERGFYTPLREALYKTVTAHCPANGLLLDAGCGEGYYTAYLAEKLSGVAVCGIDISKDALHMAASRKATMELAVASVFSVPMQTASCDTVVSVFAPCADTEFSRLLKRGGKLIRVIPAARHLLGLKAAVYPQVRLNPPEKTVVEGFALLDRQELRDDIALKTRDDIRALFQMTPYYYKTGVEDQKRLLSLDILCTEIESIILTYQKL